MEWAKCLQLTSGELGMLGEEIAVGFLARRRVKVVERNLRVGAGEIDLVAHIAGRRTAVEVRSIRRSSSSTAVAVEAFDTAKAIQVRKVANAARCQRIDLISVCFHPGGIDLHWVPQVV